MTPWEITAIITSVIFVFMLVKFFIVLKEDSKKD